MRDAGMRDAGVPDSGPPLMPDAGTDAGQSCTDLFGDTQGFQYECSAPPGQCVLYVNVDPARRRCVDICAELGWSCHGSGGAASTLKPCSIAPTGSCTSDLRIQTCLCAPP
jgi:hypothetical protein